MSDINPERLDTPAAPSPVKRGRAWNGRSLASLTLLLLFLVMAFSGIILYVTPRGRLANWTLLGLSKSQWSSLHVNSCILFLTITIIHLVLNWSVILHYLKRKGASSLWPKKEIFVATAVAAIVSVGAVYGWPPFSTVMSWNHRIKDLWENRSSSGTATDSGDATPSGAATRPGQRTLRDFAATSGVPVADCEQALVDAGYEVDSDQTLFEIGQNNGVRPRELMQVLAKQFPQTASSKECESGGECASSGRDAKECPNKGENKGAKAADKADPPKPHDGPKGFGPGQGRGMGKGRGMGQGMGWGQGKGRGPGAGGD